MAASRKVYLTTGYLLPVCLVPGTALAGAFGGGTITFGRAESVQAVPTLGGAMLVLLAILFAFVALRVLHSREQGGGVASLVGAILVGGALVAGGGGAKLLGDAWAISQVEVSITDSNLDAGNGRYETELPDNGVLATYKNSSTTTIDVLSVEPRSDDSPTCDVSGTCQEGVSLPVGDTCTANTFCNINIDDGLNQF